MPPGKVSCESNKRNKEKYYEKIKDTLPTKSTKTLTRQSVTFPSTDPHGTTGTSTRVCPSQNPHAPSYVPDRGDALRCVSGTVGECPRHRDPDGNVRCEWTVHRSAQLEATHMPWRQRTSPEFSGRGGR